MPQLIAGKAIERRLVLARERQRRAIAGREQLRLTMRAAAPDWADGMNHMPCAQVESRRDAALAGGTSHAGPHFRNRETRVIQLASCGPMNSAIHASAAEHLLVRRVDDGINIKWVMSRHLTRERRIKARKRRATGHRHAGPRNGNDYHDQRDAEEDHREPVLALRSVVFRILTRAMCTSAIPTIMPTTCSTVKKRATLICIAAAKF